MPRASGGYVESLSSYARMFLGQMEKPDDVDYIDGLSPAISIDQKTTSKNPRSTVGTVTEIYDYLRLQWARVGTPHCPICGKEIKQQTIDQIIDQVLELPEATRIQVMAPVIRGKKGEHAKVFEDARRSGYVRCRVDGTHLRPLRGDHAGEEQEKHSIEIVVDRPGHPGRHRPPPHRLGGDRPPACPAGTGGHQTWWGRTGTSCSPRYYACEGLRRVSIEGAHPPHVLLQQPLRGLPRLPPALGSQLKVGPGPGHPQTRTCPSWRGPSPPPAGATSSPTASPACTLTPLSEKYRFKLDTPVKDLSKEVMDVILYGTKGEELTLHYDQPRGKGTLHQPFEGICKQPGAPLQGDPVRRHAPGAGGLHERVPLPHLSGPPPAEGVPGGHGGRPGHRRVPATNPSPQALDFVDHLELSETQMMIAERILKEIKNRLGFLQSVGLQYLHPVPGGGLPVRRREPAHPPGHPDRLLSHGGAVYPGRALHRPAPAGQRTCSRRP